MDTSFGKIHKEKTHWMLQPFLGANASQIQRKKCRTKRRHNLPSKMQRSHKLAWSAKGLLRVGLKSNERNIWRSHKSVPQNLRPITKLQICSMKQYKINHLHRCKNDIELVTGDSNFEEGNVKTKKKRQIYSLGKRNEKCLRINVIFGCQSNDNNKYQIFKKRKE